MFLLFLIIALCSIVAFSNAIAKPIISFLKRPSSEERRILREIALIKKELSQMSLRDQYTDYIKKERKIAAHERTLSTIRGDRFTKNLIIEYGVRYGIKGITSFILLIVSILYRWEPVIVFDKKFNFTPLGGIMSFPTGIDNAISVPFWIFSSSITLRTIANYFKI